MATYVIGDVQGCFEKLQALLTLFNFDRKNDKLWFTGDLVNRGPHSLEVLRFVFDLPHAECVLGNHDLTLLTLAYTNVAVKQHNLDPILQAPDREHLLEWLRHRPLLIEDDHFECVLVHAGIPPQWSLSEAKYQAKQVETCLQSDDFILLLENMFGNEPIYWNEGLTKWDRYRYTINALTRLRFCYADGRLNLSYKGDIHSIPSDLIPWYEFPIKSDHKKILFGHWAALEGKTSNPAVIALDTGCFWGGSLTALRLEDGKRFSIPC